ncbi:MAG: fibronectin type III domain-containing protein, partial [Acidobacteriota bacterium]|nr:fibronectin type III domain-containing protein [Acidobacteriota bacterium]
LFVGGSFGAIGGQSREHIAALGATDGAASAWNPGADGDVEAIALAGTTLVVVGHFEEIAGVERLRVAALDTTRVANIALPWNPSLETSAEAVHVDAAGHVFVSGDFNFFGAVKRQNLAAFDLLTGELRPWNPGANGWVRALDVLGNVVYIGGDFTTIGGASRSRIAGLDAVTGVVSDWTADPNAPVNGLMAYEDAIYFVGNFSQIKNGMSRLRGAAVRTDGTVLAWNPAANGAIETLFVTADRVFVGGDFTTLGGVAHQRLGAVDRTTGAQVAPFAPSVSGSVIRLDVEGDVVFFGGSFGMANGSTRSNAAAVKTAPGMGDDGQLQGWNPSVSGPIYDLDAFGDVVYLAGGFGAVGGSSRPGIAMVDALPNGGSLRSWRPEDVSGGSISVIDTSETAVLFGGLLRDLNGIDIGAVLYPEAGLVGAPPPPTTPEILVRGSTLSLSWTAPPLGARPTAYVIEGGSGPGLRDLANFSTGTAATTFTAAGLGPGTYFVRMRSQNGYGAGRTTLEQAFVVGASGCSGPPAAPLDLGASMNSSSVTLAWRAAPQSIASSYRLLVGSASGASDLGAFDVGAATTFTTTAPPGAYFVRVQAVNPCGLGAPSAEAVAVVGGVPVPPGPVFALSGSVSSTTVSLAWAAPSFGTGPFQYLVEAGSRPGLANLATMTSASPSFATSGVPAGIYYVRVRALSAAGVGPAGNEIVVVVP